jgi:SAM-dependent methyltransferase
MTATLPDWLAALPAAEGVVAISEARRYAHEETAYDEQYHNDQANFDVGKGLLKHIADAGGDVSAPALEVGCGTGLMSLGLLAHSPYPLTIVTDPSPVFLKITRDKAHRAGISLDRAVFAVLQAEHLDRLPSGSLSLVAMRSTLHHVLDPDAFITQAGRVLVEGGVLAFQEPCMEGYVLMGVMMQFLPALAETAGVSIPASQRDKIELFSAAMTYYARRDVDKTEAEDKHLFRVDEVQRRGRSAGLDFSFFPNTSFDAAALARAPGQRPFLKFFRDYAQYCMSWGPELLALFDRFMTPYCGMVETASGGGSGPYFDGVFVGRKTG